MIFPHPSTAAGRSIERRASSDPGPAVMPAAVDDLAHVEQPSERERREHRLARSQERAVIHKLYGRPRLVQAAPQHCPIHDDGPGTDAPEAA